MRRKVKKGIRHYSGTKNTMAKRYAQRFAYNSKPVMRNPIAVGGAISDVITLIATRPGLSDVNRQLRSIGEPPFDYFNHAGNFLASGLATIALISAIKPEKLTPVRIVVAGLATSAMANSIEIVQNHDPLDASYGIASGALVAGTIALAHARRKR